MDIIPGITVSMYGIPVKYSSPRSQICVYPEYSVEEIINTLMQRRLNSLPIDKKHCFMDSVRHATLCESHLARYNNHLGAYLSVCKISMERFSGYLTDRNALLLHVLSLDRAVDRAVM